MGQMPKVSYLLTASVCIFILIAAVDLMTTDVPRYTGSDYLTPAIWSTDVISSISIMGMAFYNQTSIFHVYSSMKDKTTETLMTADLASFIFCAIAYALLGYFGILMFGETL
jgi:amino acid permease